MICPYNRESEICSKQYVNDLINEENGIIKGCTEGYIVKFKLMECQKKVVVHGKMVNATTI